MRPLTCSSEARASWSKAQGNQPDPLLCSSCQSYAVANSFLDFIYLFYFQTTVLTPSFPTKPTPQYPLSFTLSTFPTFLFRKGQACHGYQQNMAYQAAVRPRTSPCIKSWKGIPHQMPV